MFKKEKESLGGCEKLDELLKTTNQKYIKWRNAQENMIIGHVYVYTCREVYQCPLTRPSSVLNGK